MDHPGNYRPIEPGVTTDLAGRLTYDEYLDLGRLLDAQHPRSAHHDELLFIVQHQVTELWSVLATLTPVEYVQFRFGLGTASGFQSVQYRHVEFLLGNKNREMIGVFAHDDVAATVLGSALASPSLYDEFLRHLARGGYRIPLAVTERDWTEPYTADDGVTEVLRGIYADPERNWSAYETAEELVDLEESFQLWRFRHLKTVERIIGFKRGTGGSSGVMFLRQALDLAFFPELLAVRTSIGGSG